MTKTKGNTSMDQAESSKQKRKDMKALSLEMEQRAGKRLSGKQGRKRFQFSSREIASPAEGIPKVATRKKLQRRQCRVQIEEMKTQLAKMKDEIRDWNEQLLPAKEANLESMIAARDELMKNLMEIQAIETFLMHNLGFL